MLHSFFPVRGQRLLSLKLQTEQLQKNAEQCFAFRHKNGKHRACLFKDHIKLTLGKLMQDSIYTKPSNYWYQLFVPSYLPFSSPERKEEH